jgi:hypothetical protein
LGELKDFDEGFFTYYISSGNNSEHRQRKKSTESRGKHRTSTQKIPPRDSRKSSSSSAQDKKNRHHDNGMSSSRKKPEKISKPSNPRARFSEVARLDQTLRVIKKSFERFDHDEYKSVRKHIVQEQESADPYPIYNNVFLDLGEIVFKCADSTTAQWTRETFEKLSNKQSVCGVIVVTEADLRSMTKVTISLPWDNQEPLELPKALTSLSRANRGLDTKQWIVRKQLKPDSTPKRMVVTLMIDDPSVEYIKNHAKQLHYQLGVVKVKLYGANADEDEKNAEH